MIQTQHPAHSLPPVIFTREVWAWKCPKCGDTGSGECVKEKDGGYLASLRPEVVFAATHAHHQGACKCEPVYAVTQTRDVIPAGVIHA